MVSWRPLEGGPGAVGWRSRVLVPLLLQLAPGHWGTSVMKKIARALATTSAATAAGACVLLGAPPAFSQAAASQNAQTAGTGALEEVVVTAQFKQEKLQETPIAITALSGEQME